FFFFSSRRRHTRSKRDWSSDVCSSDLPVMPIIFIPIIGTLIVGLLFTFVIGAPVAAIFEGLTNWLEGMQGTSSILLALILGAMIAVDMGGPFNKVAFLFGS